MILDNHTLNIVGGLIVILAVLVITKTLRHYSRSTAYDFSITDLLLENGRMSKVAVIVLGAFATSSWVIVMLTLSGKITEGFYLAYGGMWVAPLIAKIVTNPTPKDAP